MEALNEEILHRRIAQHIRDDVEADHASPDVSFVQLPDSPVSPSDGDIFEEYVQRIFNCKIDDKNKLGLETGS